MCSRIEKKENIDRMDENYDFICLFYYTCGSFNIEKLSLLNLADLCFDQLINLDLVYASWATMGINHHPSRYAEQSYEK